MYGRLNIGGVNYIERFWTYTNITQLSGNQITTVNIVLDGEADFLLKLNCVSSTGAFRVRLGTSDSGIWFSSAGNALGGGNNRVLSTLFYGNGQFPFAVVPHIWFPRTGAIIMDLQDISGSTNNLEFAYHGSKLVQES